MTNLPQKEQIRTAINQYCEAKGLSKNELATQAGVSGATLSKIENRNWESIDEKLWRKIWIKVSTADEPELFKTADYSACFAACNSAKKNKFMIGITGDTGTGKTTALTQFAMRPNVFYVPYDKTMKPKQFFIALLREMGVAFEGSIHDMVNTIADQLNTLNNPLVIIDEAGKITHSMILYLHVLRDKTRKNCGFVLAGMHYFRTNLIKLSHKQKEGYAEFLRRINQWQNLDGLSKKEKEFICESHGITDKETLREMFSIKRFGDLYNAITLLKILNSEEL